MRASDRASGVFSIACGAGVAAYAWTFPAAAGHPIGPAAFPITIGCALVIAGVLLLIGGARRRSGTGIDFTAWTRDRRQAANFAIVPASVLFYAVAVERLGFLITAILLLAILFSAFGVRRARILPLAVAVTLAIHFSFYTLLRVPLPWGVLEGIAW
jgi:putative tricarboxylic transport membrane protein